MMSDTILRQDLKLPTVLLWSKRLSPDRPLRIHLYY